MISFNSSKKLPLNKWEVPGNGLYSKLLNRAKHQYRLYIALVYLGCLAFCLAGCKQDEEADVAPNPAPVTKQNILLADPFIFRHEGAYYLYGTSDVNPNLGIPVYKSTDLVNWEGPVGLAGEGNALNKGQSYGDTGFWAPYVLYMNNKFYMFYTANEHIAVAVSDSPLGPFTQTNKQPLHPDIKEIDPHVFVDEDGKKYLYFVRFDNGNRSYGAELNSDLLSVKENTITECIKQSQQWEIASGALWPVTEAPAMLKHKNTYYLFYTANDFRHPNYNVGYATSSSPLGPWVKYTNNPLIKNDNTARGTGGCEFVTTPANELIMFYHAHQSSQAPTPRKVVYSKAAFVTGENNMPDVLKVEDEKKYPQVEQ
ncbi:glycoside hydrolase family 43 protein [Sabulibacter ruber]|uniref:glycoside hydrolase family 43 protein n=1 Tax=Sabulibacter ruber TaxID=2811901 RepID=UPI001A97756D|nr:glycoside hydrolase family 43 protein [Sabulibacter ruber]